MAVYFLDANAVVKHYHVEKGTPQVEAILAEPGARHIISRLSVTEVFSALARKVREGVLTQVAYDLARRQVLKDVAATKYEIVDVTTREFGCADDLISMYVSSPGLRTLDALQLAVANLVRSTVSVDHLVTTDKRLLAVAAMEGFSVIDPEQP